MPSEDSTTGPGAIDSPASLPPPACPHCGAPLVQLREAGARARLCSSCRGLLLDASAIERQLGTPVLEAVRRAAELDPGSIPLRACPWGCGDMTAKQLRRGRERVQIDACPRCGSVWFDRGEVARVLRSAPPRRRRREPEDLWDPVARAKSKVDAADANQAWSEEEPSGWLFSFLLRLPIEGANRLFRAPVATWFLMAACVVVFGAQLVVGDGLILRFGTIPKLFLERGDGFDRILVSMFLHAGALHLLGNLYFLKVFGDNVEDRLGRVAFLFLYLVSGIAADLAHIHLYPSSDLPTIGASGAISGLLGAYMVLFPNVRIAIVPSLWNLFTQLRVPAFFYLLFWFLWQLAASELLEAHHIAWGAHAGGFLAGVLLGWLAKRLLPDARIAAVARGLRFPRGWNA